MKQRDLLGAILLPVLTLGMATALLVSAALNVAPLISASPQISDALKFASWVPPEAFSQLPAFVVSCGALVAILAYRRDRARGSLESARERSRFFFSQATLGLDEAYSLLRDQTNDRVLWVRAARAILKSRDLAKRIELDEYTAAYRLYEEKIRNDLYLALTIYDAESGRRDPLPPQFFYGGANWKDRKSLDETAAAASAPIKAYSVTLDDVPPTPPLQPLAERSVLAVFGFLDYPSDYDDPLDEVQPWPERWSDIHGVKAGAARYLEHRKTKIAIGGKLIDRESQHAG